ncbi:hypothetical protein [Nocardiopsis nanhaiensis]
MTAPHQVGPGVRQRLAAPRGRRFSRPGSNRQSAAPPESHQERQERLLRQMEGNPHLAYTLQHHAVPHWAEVTRQRRERAGQKARQAQRAREATVPSPTQLTTPTRGRHRAPRRWWAWPAVAVGATLLFAHTQAESLGEAAFQAGFPL